MILEIENKSLTHRPDCFGIIGFAREVAGILGQKFEEPKFLLEETYLPEGARALLNDIVIEGFFNNPAYKSSFSSIVFAAINAEKDIQEV